MKFPKLTYCELIAHRGASLDAPENTICAYELAADKGFKWIEVDVQLTKDRVPVMLHDHTIDRTTYETGFINDLTFNDIKKIDASKGHSAFKDICIPTLEETIDVCLEKGLGLILEMKPIQGADIVTAKKVAQVVKEKWPIENQNLIVSSFSGVSLIAFKQFLPCVSLAFAAVVPPLEPKELMSMLGVSGFHFNYEFAIKYGVADLLESGAQVIVATVNDLETANKLFDMGIHGVMTDNSILL